MPFEILQTYSGRGGLFNPKVHNQRRKQKPVALSPCKSSKDVERHM